MKTLRIALGDEPLSLRDTLDCGQAFRWIQNSDGSFSGIVGDCEYKVSIANGSLVIESAANAPASESFWRNYFALDLSYADMQKKYATDPVLAECVSFAPGIRVVRQEFFETLISFLISQNNNIPRIKGIIERLCDNFGEVADNGSPSARHAFPSAEKLASLSPDDLAVLRAGYRADFILRTSRAFAENPALASEIATSEFGKAREMLLKLHGVGPKVADCVLLFGLGRFEAFPVDVWIKRAMSALFPNGLPDVAASTAGIAQQYIFNYARSSGKLK